MKNLVCKRLAACLRMKQPPSPSPELPLVRRNKSSADAGDHFGKDPTSSSDSPEIEAVQSLLEEIRDLLKTRVHVDEEQRCEDDKENEMKHDWMLAAAVLDRISAIIVTAIFVVGTLTFIAVFAARR